MPLKRKKRKEPNYCSYIHKVLKQIHPELSIQQKTMLSINSLLDDVMHRLNGFSAKTAFVAKKNTLQATHVKAAVGLLMRDKLATHAIAEGSKAVALFSKK